MNTNKGFEPVLTLKTCKHHLSWYIIWNMVYTFSLKWESTPWKLTLMTKTLRPYQGVKIEKGQGFKLGLGKKKK
jgi:hypothetical protein